MEKINIFTPYKRFEINNPLIFLAGPIMGADNWQDRSIEIIRRMNNEVTIASPRQNKYDEINFSLDEQTDWESYHLEKASKHGAIIFWLTRERKHSCERAYAQTTRFELGEWVAKQKFRPEQVFLSVGIEDGFTNSGYIKRRIEQDNLGVKICKTLEETCNQALQIVESRHL